MYSYKPLIAFVASVGILLIPGTASTDTLPVAASDGAQKSVTQITQAQRPEVAGVSFSIGFGGGNRGYYSNWGRGYSPYYYSTPYYRYYRPYGTYYRTYPGYYYYGTPRYYHTPGKIYYRRWR